VRANGTGTGRSAELWPVGEATEPEPPESEPDSLGFYFRYRFRYLSDCLRDENGTAVVHCPFGVADRHSPSRGPHISGKQDARDPEAAAEGHLS
jgi:hypothetical protein